MITASGLLGGHAYYLHWGVIQLSLANLIVIVAMVVVFIAALVLPFPGSHSDGSDEIGEVTDVGR